MKLDITKAYKSYFTAKQKPELVTIQPAQFISICGKGDPDHKPFSEKIEALYSTAYTIKFAFKEKGMDFVVCKLEGLWWFDEKLFTGKSMVETATSVPRNEWQYRLLIRMPDYVTRKDLELATRSVLEKKGLLLALDVEYFEMNEGTCVQMLHVGPFSTEPKSLQIMDQFIREHALAQNGLHHEIYLSDFRKTEPHKLRTILREPVK